LPALLPLPHPARPPASAVTATASPIFLAKELCTIRRVYPT